MDYKVIDIYPSVEQKGKVVVCISDNKTHTLSTLITPVGVFHISMLTEWMKEQLIKDAIQ